MRATVPTLPLPPPETATPEPSPRGGSRWARAVPAAVLSLLTALVFLPTVLGRAVFAERDMLRVYAPVSRFWAERVRQGELPQWMPLDGLGQPLVAMVVTSALHPLKLLYLLLPVGPALTINTLLCFPVAALGVRALARRLGTAPAGALFAAVAYAFCGYLVCITNNLPYLQAAATLPWALWAAARFLQAPSAARLLLGGVLLAGVLYAGEVQSFTVTCAAVLLLGLTQAPRPLRSGARALALVAVAGLLAAPQLFASLGVMDAIEPGARSLGGAQSLAFHPLRLPELLLGPVYALPSAEGRVPPQVVSGLRLNDVNYLWTDSAFLGLPALALALTGLLAHRRDRRVLAWAGAWALVLLLALGGSTPLYALAYQLLPPWRLFRYPEKLLPFVALGVSLAAALGWRAVFEGAGRRTLVRVCAAAAALALVLLAAELLGGAWSRGVLLARWPKLPAVGIAELSSVFVHHCGVAAASGLLCALALARATRPVLGALTLGAVQLGTTVLAHGHIPMLAPPELLQTPPPFAQRIAERTAPDERVPTRVVSAAQGIVVPRTPAELSFAARFVIGSASALAPDSAGLWGLENAEGYMPAVSRRSRLVKRDLPRWYGVLAPLFGARYAVFSRAQWQQGLGPGVQQVEEDAAHGLVLAAYTAARPRAFLAFPRCVGNQEQALALLQDPAVLAGTRVALECEGRVQEAEGGEPERLRPVRVVAYAPDQVEVDVEAPPGAVLVVNDALHPGWSAQVDGAAAPILAANVAVRGVPLPAGAHRVVLRYVPPGLRAGVAVAALTALLLVLAALWQRREALKSST